MNKGELIIAIPHNDQAIVNQMVEMLREAKAETLGRIEAATESLTPDTFDGKKRKEFDGDVKYFTDGLKRFEAAVLAETRADAVMNQIVDVKTAVYAAAQAYKAKWDGIKNDMTPPSPKDFHAIMIECTQSAWVAIDKFLSKTDGLNIGASYTVDACDVKKITDAMRDAGEKREERIKKARSAIEA